MKKLICFALALLAAWPFFSASAQDGGVPASLAALKAELKGNKAFSDWGADVPRFQGWEGDESQKAGENLVWIRGMYAARGGLVVALPYQAMTIDGEPEIESVNLEGFDRGVERMARFTDHGLTLPDNIRLWIWAGRVPNRFQISVNRDRRWGGITSVIPDGEGAGTGIYRPWEDANNPGILVGGVYVNNARDREAFWIDRSRVQTSDARTVTTNPPAPVATSSWYTGPDGIASTDRRMPRSVPENPRHRYQAALIEGRRANSYIAWVTAFPAAGTRGGSVAVFDLDLDWVVERDGRTELVTSSHQRYNNGDRVAGGWFPFNDQGWFQLGMNNSESFTVADRVVNGARRSAAIIDVTRFSDPQACGHIWDTHWPRLVPPAGTVAVRISCTFLVEGDALVHMGVDRYETERTKDQPDQEVLVSDTYALQHCVGGRPVTVTMQTSRINWQD